MDATSKFVSSEKLGENLEDEHKQLCPPQSSKDATEFPLLALPRIPLVHVLSYLDEQSVRQAQLVCFPLCHYINKFKIVMNPTAIHQVSVRRVRNINTENELLVEVEIQKSVGSVPNCQYFAYDKNSQEELTELPVLDVDHEMINKDKCFFEWISEKLVNVQIELLEISQVRLPFNTIEFLEHAFRNSRIQTERININDSFYDAQHVDILMRFVRLFNTKKLDIFENNPEIAHTIATPFFLDYLSTLSHFWLTTSIEGAESSTWTTLPSVPNHVFKFPPLFILGPGFTVSIESVKRAVQAWSLNRQSIKNWVVFLPISFNNADMFLRALALPYDAEPSGSFSFKNTADQKLYVLSCSHMDWRNELVCGWYLGTDEMERSE